jgi:hypothetical protein
MDSFAAREKAAITETKLEELFLTLTDGRLLAHVASKAKEDDASKDKTIMAGMLVAIRGYVQEGLRTEKKTSLDSIKYGDYNLLIETEKTLVLAAVIKGVDTPDLRQEIRDQLMLIKKRYGKDLLEWDGNQDKTEKAERDLKKFIKELS